jgi:hypothetical protein
MELEEAERRISEVFPTEAGSKDTLSDEEALDLLDVMEAPIRSGWRGPRDNLATYLFYTCAKFDRWDTPSPVVVPPSYPDQFERTLSLFRLVEDQRSEFVSLSNSMASRLNSTKMRLSFQAAPRLVTLTLKNTAGD